MRGSASGTPRTKKGPDEGPLTGDKQLPSEADPRAALTGDK